MIVTVSDPVAVLLDVVVWTALGFGIGLRFARQPFEALSTEGPVTRIRPFEHRGNWYQRWFRIRAWKDRLPEAGAAFKGGMSKRTLPGLTPDHLERFAHETCRAELVHWWLLVSSVVFVLWNPPWLFAIMVAYAVVANLPFIAVQRFNRARITAALRRRARRTHMG